MKIIKTKIKKKDSKSAKQEAETKAKAADALAVQYMNAQEILHTAGDNRDRVVSNIITFAGQNGEEEGKRKVVNGNNYVVGFSTPESTPDLDYEKLRSVVSKKTLKSIEVTTISAELVEQAVARGDISRKTLMDCLVPSTRKASPRVYVAERKARPNEDSAKKV